MILGAVLAGGRSTRFGSDKARAVWRGRPLIDHVIDRLGLVCTRVIVVGRTHERCPSLPDRPAPDLGPLGGLNAALHFALETGIDRVLTAPCDTPSLPGELLAALTAANEAVVLEAMPVIGCWPSALAPRLDAHIGEDGRRSMRGWAALVGARSLALPPPSNINRPLDLNALNEEE